MLDPYICYGMKEYSANIDGKTHVAQIKSGIDDYVLESRTLVLPDVFSYLIMKHHLIEFGRGTNEEIIFVPAEWLLAVGSITDVYIESKAKEPVDVEQEIKEIKDILIDHEIDRDKPLSTLQAAKYLGISRAALYKLTHQKRIRYSKNLGKNWFKKPIWMTFSSKMTYRHKKTLYS